MAELCKIFVSHTHTYSSKERAGVQYPFTKEERDAIVRAIDSLNKDRSLQNKIQLQMIDMDNSAGPGETDAEFFLSRIRQCEYFIGVVEFDGISTWSRKEYETALRRKKRGTIREVFMFAHTEGEEHSEINKDTFLRGSSGRRPWINGYENSKQLEDGIKECFKAHYSSFETHRTKRDRFIRIMLGIIALVLALAVVFSIFREPINGWFNQVAPGQKDSTIVAERGNSDDNKGVASEENVEGENHVSPGFSSSGPSTTGGKKGAGSGKQEREGSTSESLDTSESSKSTEPETVEITPSESFEEEVTVSGTVIADETISKVPKLSIGDNIEVVPGLKETIVLLSSNGNSGYVMYHEGRHASEFLSNLDMALYYDGCVYPTIEELMEIYKHRAVIGVWSGIIRSGTPAGRNEHFALDFSNGEKIAVKDKRTDVYNLLIRHFAK